VETIKKEELVQLEGGGPGTWCGLTLGLTVGSYFINPVLGLYLSSKAIGVCAIEAALT
jgi:hypothetical protein